jgi:hypothetical protein
MYNPFNVFSPGRLSRAALLGDNQQMRAHLFELGALREVHAQAVMDLHDDLAQTAAESENLGELAALDGPAQTPTVPLPIVPAGLGSQPLILPADAREARLELGRVLSDRGRVERINDNLRRQLREKDDQIALLAAELKQARLAILAPAPARDMIVPWQPLSSAA